MGIVYYHHYQPKVKSDATAINEAQDDFCPDNIKYDPETVDFTVSCESPIFEYSEDDFFADRLFFTNDEKSAFYVATVGYERSWLERIAQGKRIDRYIIHFVFEGSGTVNSVPVTRGQAFICLPGEKYTIMNDTKDPMRHGWISVGGYDLENQIELFNMPKAQIINIRDIDRAEKFIKNTVYCQKAKPPSENMKNLLLSRLFRVLSLLDFEVPAKLTDNSAHTRYISIVNDYINTHYSENITVGDLARHAGVSMSYLRYIFTSNLDISPLEALIQKRMSVAKKLLKETKMPLSVVATECGYSDQSAFCKVFKKTQAISPLKYRKQSQMRE